MKENLKFSFFFLFFFCFWRRNLHFFEFSGKRNLLFLIVYEKKKNTCVNFSKYWRMKRVFVLVLSMWENEKGEMRVKRVFGLVLSMWEIEKGKMWKGWDESEKGVCVGFEYMREWKGWDESEKGVCVGFDYMSEWKGWDESEKDVCVGFNYLTSTVRWSCWRCIIKLC
jgi:hypothetical protein